MTALTWNCEGIKNGIFALKDVLCEYAPDLVFLNESQIFSADIDTTLGYISGSYCFSLNSDDVHDSDLPLTRSKSHGGTLLLWKKHFDPYISIEVVNTPAFSPLLLQLPGYHKSVHIALYLPTSGKEQEFVAEITNLRVYLDNLSTRHPDTLIFIRGDSNANKNKASRCVMVQQLLNYFTLASVAIDHPTYHHFTGNGLHL